MAQRDWSKVYETVPEDSWLRQWMEAFEMTEPPRSYIFFSALAMLGGCLGRRVYFDLDIHRVYPLMNLLLIGPSGLGKSTSLRDIAEAYLVRPLPDTETKPMVITGKTTKEACHQDLMVNPHAIIMASELANLFSKERYMEGALPYFTDLLDLAPARIRTLSHSSQVVEKPECCVVGGSTREWLQDMLPSSSGEGGFLPRFLIIVENHRYRRISDPSRAISPKQRLVLAGLRDQAFYDFRHILEAASGRIDFEDYEASDRYDYWYKTHLGESGLLAPFAARAGAHVLRLSLLIALSRFASSIGVGDVECGINLYNYATSKLLEVIVPMSAHGKMVSKLLDALGTEERSGVQLRRALRNHCGGTDVDRMLGDLVRDKEIILSDGMYRRVNG